MIVFLFLFCYGLLLAFLQDLLSCSSWSLASPALAETLPEAQKSAQQ